MAALSENWITEKHIDFEYKRYLLLAYLQEVSEHFTENRLYPSLGELITHYRSLVSLKENKKNLYESFPERLSGADFPRFQMIYEKLMNDDQLMQELENIIEFSIPQFEKYLSEGRKIYDFIEARMNIFPVGIIPLHADEGYLMLKYAPEKSTIVFEYQITIFENPDEKYRAISTQYIGSWDQSIHNTYEQIKSDLIKYHHKLPNPATYAIESELKIPLNETFLPLAKRTLVKYVATQPGSVQ